MFRLLQGVRSSSISPWAGVFGGWQSAVRVLRAGIRRMCFDDGKAGGK